MSIHGSPAGKSASSVSISEERRTPETVSDALPPKAAAAAPPERIVPVAVDVGCMTGFKAMFGRRGPHHAAAGLAPAAPRSALTPAVERAKAAAPTFSPAIIGDVARRCNESGVVERYREAITIEGAGSRFRAKTAPAPSAGAPSATGPAAASAAAIPWAPSMKPKDAGKFSTQGGLKNTLFYHVTPKAAEKLIRRDGFNPYLSGNPKDLAMGSGVYAGTNDGVRELGLPSTRSQPKSVLTLQANVRSVGRIDSDRCDALKADVARIASEVIAEKGLGVADQFRLAAETINHIMRNDLGIDACRVLSHFENHIVFFDPKRVVVLR